MSVAVAPGCVAMVENPPKLPQAPPASVALARCSSSLPEETVSTPLCASVPSSSVTGTEAVL